MDVYSALFGPPRYPMTNVKWMDSVLDVLFAMYNIFQVNQKKLCSLLRMPAHVAACVGNAGHGSLISATKLFIFHHGHEQKPPPRPLQRWNQFTRRAGAMDGGCICRI